MAKQPSDQIDTLSAEQQLQAILAKLKVDKTSHALQAIAGLQERVTFTRDFETIKFELHKLDPSKK